MSIRSEMASITSGEILTRQHRTYLNGRFGFSVSRG
jgi:hypothetical protein